MIAESFTYVDIFATKGIEYIVVICALLLFIPFWRSLSVETEYVLMQDGGVPFDIKEEVIERCECIEEQYNENQN